MSLARNTVSGRSAVSGRTAVSGRSAVSKRNPIFSPNAVDSSVQGWFEAGFVSLDGNGRTVSMQDLSNSGSTMVQATAAQRVLWTRSDANLGGRPALNNITNSSTGDGTSLTYTAHTTQSYGAFTLYLACYWGTCSTNSLIVNGSILMFTNSGNSVLSARAPTNAATGNVNTKNPLIICFQTAATGGTDVLYVNNASVPLATGTGATGSFSTLSVMINSGTNPGNCAMGAFGAFGSNHNQSQRAAIMQYLAKFYGVTLTG